MCVLCAVVFVAGVFVGVVSVAVLMKTGPRDQPSSHPELGREPPLPKQNCWSTVPTVMHWWCELPRVATRKATAFVVGCCCCWRWPHFLKSTCLGEKKGNVFHRNPPKLVVS